MTITTMTKAVQRFKLATLLSSPILMSLLSAPAAASPALPVLDNVVSGNVSIRSTKTTMNITQTTNKAIIDWRKFNIGKTATVNFAVPSQNAITLNRVTGTKKSSISGALNSNGNVWLINPNGIVFNKTARVDVSGLVATTANITNANFLADNFVFQQPHNKIRKVENKGTITVHDGGLAAFVAPTVENEGVITANLGTIHMATGTQFTIDLYGDGLIHLGVSIARKHKMELEGTLRAKGGRILIDVADATKIVNRTINLKGVIEANSALERAGEIILTATANDRVKVSARMDVSGVSRKQGKIIITAGKIQNKGGSANISGGHILTLNTAKAPQLTIINNDLGPIPARPITPREVRTREVTQLSKTIIISQAESIADLPEAQQKEQSGQTIEKVDVQVCGNDGDATSCKALK